MIEEATFIAQTLSMFHKTILLVSFRKKNTVNERIKITCNLAGSDELAINTIFIHAYIALKLYYFETMF